MKPAPIRVVFPVGNVCAFRIDVMRICIGSTRGTVSKRWVGFLGIAFISISVCRSVIGAQSVSLSWNPNADTNVTGYAMYIGSTSGNYSSRIDVGTNTASTLTGLSNGSTYYFVATAYDLAGVESAPSNEAQFAAPTNNPPVFNPVTNYNVAVFTDLIISNSASDSINGIKLTYSLAAGAPTNMVINPTNGLLDWPVPLSAAGTTNPVTVQVVDNSTPPASAIQTFTVTVSNFAQLSFGSSVVALGQTSSVPLIFNSSVGVTNVSFVLDIPGNRMTNLSVISLTNIVTITQGTNGAAHSLVTIKAATGTSIQGPITVGQINYKAVPNLPSCFATLKATAISATQSNGLVIPTTLNGFGQAVLVGSQALTKACTTTNGLNNLTIYGPAGTNCQLQSRIGLTGTWTNELPAAIMSTNLYVTYSNVPSSRSMKFYRVHAM
jgi:hypothetical protein